jgi:ParB/RepB/Spo0J family partition protein
MKNTIKSPAVQALKLPAAALSVPRARLHPDPDQPRKTFAPAEMEEQRASLLANGILEPLLVRPHPTKPGEFLIVDGERRWRAAAELKLESLPVVVRPLTDAEARRYQIISGTQRVNLTALEAADALWAQFNAARDREGREKKAGEPGTTFESFAGELGIKRSTAYNRRALAQAPAPVRAALQAGTLDTAHAALVLTVQPPDAQAKLLKQITSPCDYNFPYSYRDLQHLIEQDYRVSLKHAPFNTDKDYLVPVGFDARAYKTSAPAMETIGSCEKCPHRTGNLAEHCPELKASPNVCTLPPCFRAKAAAHTRSVLEKARASGRTIIPAEQFQKERGLVPARRDIWVGMKPVPLATLAKRAKTPIVPAVTVNHAGEAVEVYTAAQVKEIESAAGVKERDYSADERRARRVRQQKEKATKAALTAAIPKILDKLVRGSRIDARLWPLLALAAYNALDISRQDFTARRLGVSKRLNDSRAALKKWFKDHPGPADNVRILVELLLLSRPTDGGWYKVKWNATVLAVAKLAGLKLEAAVQERANEK